MKDSIEIATILAYKDEPFIGLFMWNLNIMKHEPVETAGITVKDGRVTLMYNPEWFDNILSHRPIQEGDEFRCGVLKHEVYHVIEEHFERGLKITRGSDKKIDKEKMQIANLAMDMAINPFIKELKKYEKGLPWEKDGKKYLEHFVFPASYGFPEKLHMEDYYNRLLQQGGDGGGGKGKTLDNHDFWGETPDDKDSGGQDKEGQDKEGQTNQGISEEMRQKIMQEMVERVYREMQERQLSWGKTPEHIKHKILEIVNRVHVPWQRLLQQVVTTSIGQKYRYTFERPNRTLYSLGYGFRSHIDPEMIIENCSRINILMDVSGSMSDRSIAQINAQMRYLHTQGHQLTVIYADTEVIRAEKYSPSKGVYRYGCGGTSFVPACVYAKKLKADFNIYFTDSYGDYPSVDQMPPLKKFLWVVNGRADMVPPTHGRKIRMIDSSEHSYDP